MATVPSEWIFDPVAGLEAEVLANGFGDGGLAFGGDGGFHGLCLGITF